MEELRPQETSRELARFAGDMKRQVVGQDRAVDRLTDSLSRVIAGIQDPERPLLTMLFLGPTGVGKTETVRALADLLFGSRRAFTRVNCQEYAAQYNLAKLLGSPPGYVGGEVTPLLAQATIDKHHVLAAELERGLLGTPDGRLARAFPAAEGRCLSLILFDEVEKAHPKLWDLLLGLLEDGTVILGNNEETDFRRAIVVLTSNVGSEAMGVHLAHESIGFATVQAIGDRDHDVEQAALRAARKTFPFEFLNRFDELITFRPLRERDLVRILDILVGRFHLRSLRSTAPFLLELTPAAKGWLIERGFDARFGARPLQRLVEAEVVTPLSHYLVAGHIGRGDLILVDADADGLRFLGRRADLPAGEPLMPVRPPDEVPAARAAATGGRGEQEDITEEVRQVKARGREL
jgi:ATP-dependent Clp protease ATP-binding subunit ClpC